MKCKNYSAVVNIVRIEGKFSGRRIVDDKFGIW